MLVMNKSSAYHYLADILAQCWSINRSMILVIYQWAVGDLSASHQWTIGELSVMYQWWYNIANGLKTIHKNLSLLFFKCIWQNFMSIYWRRIKCWPSTGMVLVDYRESIDRNTYRHQPIPDRHSNASQTTLCWYIHSVNRYWAKILAECWSYLDRLVSAESTLSTVNMIPQESTFFEI